MKVTIDIPDRDWYLIAGRAETAGVKVADLLYTAARNLVANNPERTLTRDRVAELVNQGIPDPVIAHRMSLSVAHVAELRRAAHLKPVKFRRAHWEHELLERNNVA